MWRQVPEMMGAFFALSGMRRLKTRISADFICPQVKFAHLEKGSAVSFRARENDISKVTNYMRSEHGRRGS